MIKVGVLGAKGRMGAEVVRAVRDADGLELVAALDLGDSLDELIKHGAEVVVDFTTPDSVMANLDFLIKNNLNVILCIGDSIDEKKAGKTLDICKRELAAVIKAVNPNDWSKIVIAYEPIWAIGTGKVASAHLAQDMHRAIRLQLAEFDEDVASHVGILYGGSVKSDNAVELFAMPDIDGGLIGGASLSPQDFLAICQA
jgi:triosephosphate isomerase